MAAAVATRLFRASTPEAIEPDLAALWREITQPDMPIARAVMSNLVVFRSRTPAPVASPEAVAIDQPTEDVLARHPSRLIVLEHARVTPTAGAPFAVSVGIAVFGPEHARYGVEQIVAQSACAEAALPSIVRRFIRGDLPTTVWWREDLSQIPPLAALVTMGRQLIYDSRQWSDVARGVRAIAPLVGDRYADLADLNWRRLSAVRRALKHARRAGAIAAATQDAPVHIAHRPGEGALAWLLAGTLMAGQQEPARPQVDDSAPDDTVLLLTIRGGSGKTTVTLTAQSVVVDDGSGTPLVVTVPVEHEADAVAAELRTLSQDADLGAAIRALDGHLNAR